MGKDFNRAVFASCSVLINYMQLCIDSIVCALHETKITLLISFSFVGWGSNGYIILYTKSSLVIISFSISLLYAFV